MHGASCNGKERRVRASRESGIGAPFPINRLSEIGLDVKDVRFPTWGAALSCILQFNYPREGFVNDALMTAMGAPWLNTKLVVAVSHVSPIKAAVCRALRIDDRATWRMQLDVASVTRIGRRPDGGAYLVAFNEASPVKSLRN